MDAMTEVQKAAYQKAVRRLQRERDEQRDVEARELFEARQLRGVSYAAAIERQADL